MRKLFLLITVVLFTCSAIVTSFAAEQGKTFLVHLKTGLKKDDAQICVAYNVIWAALKKGHTVKVLVDADAINTYKIGWGGKDDIEEYKIPENLRVALSKQFEVVARNDRSSLEGRLLHGLLNAKSNNFIHCQLPCYSFHYQIGGESSIGIRHCN